ncbi:BTAD domain-containing putative transcriptional regulator, partial [Nocardiopsis sp. CC223A]|uniref:BTAD domain-containing putative transcriptional regulator n=1 Tax=Nocardiopsis sp. CC223A TaxID=3044051 RepID=UPI00278C136E
MHFRLLGPLAVETADGRPVRVPELKVRRLLAVLLTGEGRAVPADRLIDGLWGDAPPARPLPALRAKASQLRRALAEAEPGGRDLVVSVPSGYRIAAGPGDTDAGRFRRLLEQARTAADPRLRSVLLSDALALWRGPALADFADEPFARPVAAHLEEQRLAALEEHAQTRLDLGEHHLLVGDLAALVDEHPLRERARALHMLALYRSGRGPEALAGYAEAAHRLRGELGVDPGAELASLHRRILARDPALLPPADPPGTPRRRSAPPAPVGELIGRADLVGRLREVVRAERLVTLTGPGGIGKSRLALELARDAADAFPGGVWWVEAEAGRPPRPDGASCARIARAVADALELRDPLPAGADGDLVHRVADALRPSRALLVLDGCERVLDGVADLVGRLLGEVPGLHVLTTGQEPLGIAGEWLHAVPPLELPAPDADAATACTAGAVELFVRRAAAAAPGFALTDADVGPVATLCRRLDGVPLALELAATRVRDLGVRGVAERLDDRFRLLTGSPRRTPARQRTLRAAMDWSWDLLTAAERRVLRRLAAHADGCAPAGAAAVCAGADVPAEEVADVLGRLVSRSLVVMAEEEAGPRYRLLESVALYCGERLAEAGEGEEAAVRHARHYTGLAEHAAPFLYGPEQRTWLRRLDAEAANLRLALDTARRTRADDLFARLVRSLLWYWYLRGRVQECRRALDALLSRPGTLPPGEREHLSVWADGLGALAGAGPDPAVFAGGHLAAPPDPARDPLDTARSRWFAATVLFTVGGNGPGAALTEAALAGFGAHGDRWGVAAALAQRARFRLVAGDHTAAARDGERSLALFTELGDGWGRVQAGDALASLAEVRGDHAAAGRHHREGLRVAEELGLWHDVPWKLSGLGRAALAAGDHAAAREHHLRAVRVAREHSDRAGLAYAETGLAMVARREGEPDEAERLLSGLHRRLRGQGGVLLAQVLVERGL